MFLLSGCYVLQEFVHCRSLIVSPQGIHGMIACTLTPINPILVIHQEKLDSFETHRKFL
jgi:hypothetical protein